MFDSPFVVAVQEKKVESVYYYLHPDYLADKLLLPVLAFGVVEDLLVLAVVFEVVVESSQVDYFHFDCLPDQKLIL